MTEAADAVELILTDGVERAMERFNPRGDDAAASRCCPVGADWVGRL